MVRAVQVLGHGYELRSTRDGLRIFDPANVELRYRPSSVAEARDRVHRHMQRLQERVRPCLCCSRQFRSRHIGNRLCDLCKNQSEGLL